MSSARTFPSYPGTARRGRRSRVLLSIAFLSVGLTGTDVLPAAAQVAAAQVQTAATPGQPAAGTPDAIQQRAQELEAARQQQKSAAELQAKLKADIAAIGQDRSKLNQQLIDIAAQVRGVENNIGEAETRLRSLDSREQQIRMTLGSRRAEVVEVLAALQRAGRRTPPALLVTPEDALHQMQLREAKLAEQVASLDKEIQTYSQQLPRLFLLESEYLRVMFETELKWVRSIIADLQSGQLTWHHDWLRPNAPPETDE